MFDATWFDVCYLMHWNSYIFKHSLNVLIFLGPLFCMLHIKYRVSLCISLTLSVKHRRALCECAPEGWSLAPQQINTNKLSGPVLEKDPLSQCESPAQSREVRKTLDQAPCGPPVQDVWPYHADRVLFSILSYCFVLSEHSWSCLWASEEWEVPLYRNENCNWIICS